MQQLIKSASKLDVDRLQDGKWLSGRLIEFFGDVYELTLAQFLEHPLLICGSSVFWSLHQAEHDDRRFVRLMNRQRQKVDQNAEQLYVLLPIHRADEKHWALGSILVLKGGTTHVLYLDSLFDTCPEHIARVLLKASKCL